MKFVSEFFLRNLFPIKVRLFVCVFFFLRFELELLTNIAISVNMLRIRANVLRYPEQIQISRKKNELKKKENKNKTNCKDQWLFKGLGLQWVTRILSHRQMLLIETTL